MYLEYTNNFLKMKHQVDYGIEQNFQKKKDTNG